MAHAAAASLLPQSSSRWILLRAPTGCTFGKTLLGSPARLVPLAEVARVDSKDAKADWFEWLVPFLSSALDTIVFAVAGGSIGVAVVLMPWEPVRNDLRLVPLLWAGIVLFGALYTLMAVLAKKLFMGTQKAGAHAYGSWRFRLDRFVDGVMLGWFTWVGLWLIGTEWYCVVLRAFGARIGRDCILSSVSSVTNYDMTTIGDGVQMHFGAQLQGHTFEGKQMKVDHVRIGDGCQLAANAMVLQDTVLEKNVVLHANTLILKGDHLNEATEWRGNPPTLVQQQLILGGNRQANGGMLISPFSLEQMELEDEWDSDDA